MSARCRVVVDLVEVEVDVDVVLDAGLLGVKQGQIGGASVPALGLE